MLLLLQYEKELWAGLRYTLEDPKVAVDVYTSGNVVFKGLQMSFCVLLQCL